MANCMLCPRLCGVDRQAGQTGFCGQDGQIRIARAALHPFEEPPISGVRGSGTVFFVGCSLRCEFCQNRVISRADRVGRVVDPEELADIFLSLEAEGAHNINLVTPTHFADGVIAALMLARPKLTVPVVCGELCCALSFAGVEAADTDKIFFEASKAAARIRSAWGAVTENNA